jgi:hypothetical protein
MGALSRLAFALLLAALALSASDAFAARALLAELLARAPAAAGQPANQPAMSGLALEACLRRAKELDLTGVTVDMEVSDIDRLAAEGMFLQRQIDAELSMVGDYDENGLNAFQRRVIRHEELARKFKADFPAYRGHQQAYNDAVVDFERDCSSPFTAGDLDAAKARLGIK